MIIHLVVWGRLPWQHFQSLQYLHVIDTSHQFNKGREAAQAGPCLLYGLLIDYFAHCVVKTSEPATGTPLIRGFFFSPKCVLKLKIKAESNKDRCLLSSPLSQRDAHR